MTANTAPAARLTANETAILKAFPTFQYVDGQDIEEGVSVWQWSFTDDAAAAAGLSLRAVKGVLSSLSKKGLIATDANTGPADERQTWITALGAEVIKSLQDPKPEPVIAEPTAELLVAAANVKVGDVLPSGLPGIADSVVTATNLTKTGRVTIRFTDGTSAPGRITRLAADRIPVLRPAAAAVEATPEPEPTTVEATPEAAEATPEPTPAAPAVEHFTHARFSIAEVKVSKHYWNSFGGRVAALVAEHYGVPAGEASGGAGWDKATGTATFPTTDDGTAAASALLSVWREGWAAFNSWRRTDAAYKALPSQDTKWVTSDRFRWEREYLVGFAYGYLGTPDALDTYAARAGADVARVIAAVVDPEPAPAKKARRRAASKQA